MTVRKVFIIFIMENNNMKTNDVITNCHPDSAGGCYKLFWTNYANFSGRARRSEFWWPYLFNGLIMIILFCILPILGLLFILATLIPNLTLYSRRLHDTGRAFGWYFISGIPIVGALLLLIWTLTDSQPGENRFGANPKGF